MGLFGGSKDPEDLINSAMALMQRKQPKAAVALFKKALKNDPENVIALYNQGLAFNQLKKYLEKDLWVGTQVVVVLILEI